MRAGDLLVVPRSTGLHQLRDQEGPAIAILSSTCKYSRLVQLETDLEIMLPESFKERPGQVTEIRRSELRAMREIQSPPSESTGINLDE